MTSFCRPFPFPVPPARGLPGARAALALLLAINLFNYIDRQVLAAVVPKIEVEFHCDKSQIGWLMSMFLVSYTIAAPVFGWLGDRWSQFADHRRRRELAWFTMAIFD